MPISVRRFFFLSIVVGLLAALPFLPGFPGDFVFDDFPNIVNNQAIQMTHLDADGLSKAAFSPQPSGSLRALPTLSFALDFWRAGGAEPAAFKATNVLLQSLTALALAWMFRALLLVAKVPVQPARWIALALALAWAVHPLQVSSVLYTVQRIQTMATFFVVLALWAYLHARTAQIEGKSGRTGLLLAFLSWALALGCKEDAILLPAYTLALELTVLRFAAGDARIETRLRRSYLGATLLGFAVYCMFVIPHYWEWEAYPGRDFSSIERLLTQARMLCLYIWQIVLPLPRHMPFYFDWVQPSRGLLQPWTTLPALLLVAGLLALAWHQRHRRPLLSLGILWFFSAHFVASNVIGLELAFEHRNHFALAGAVLAIGSLLAEAANRLQIRTQTSAVIASLLIASLVCATAVRAREWQDRLSLARAITQHAPLSARGWVELCAGEYETGGGAVKDNPRLDAAIDACTKGTQAVPDSLNNPALLVVLKTLQGNVPVGDWELLQTRLATVYMSFDNCRAPLILSYNYRRGVAIDKRKLMDVLHTMMRRCDQNSFSAASVGYFVMNDLGEPEMALPYFMRAIEGAPPHDPFPAQLAMELRQKGRPDLARRIEQLAASRRSAPEASKAPGR